MNMYRIGFGYDSHRFAADAHPLMLGGVAVEYEKGLAAHSDGDLVAHALTDAILGALAAGDIGEHFSDTDPQYKDAPGRVFIEYARRLAERRGYRLGNCDIVILAEAPKLGPYKRRIAENLAALLGAAPEDVSVKAKTNEAMGFVGHGEGIACMATVLLVRKES